MSDILFKCQCNKQLLHRSIKFWNDLNIIIFCLDLFSGMVRHDDIIWANTILDWKLTSRMYKMEKSQLGNYAHIHCSERCVFKLIWGRSQKNVPPPLKFENILIYHVISAAPTLCKGARMLTYFDIIAYIMQPMRLYTIKPFDTIKIDFMINMFPVDI